MLCQNCKINEASSHIHSVVNGVVRDMYLCSECAEKIHGKAFNHDDIFDLLSSFLSTGKQSVSDTVRCECCGTSYETIAKTGRVGCGNCYKTFGRQLEPALVRIHGRTSHVGKRVANSVKAEDNVIEAVDNKAVEIAKLQKELETAVKNEEYEKAAVIRDKIKKAKGE